jgi:hypothetical protein
MKSIKFRKIIITRKYKKKKYHGSRQRTRRIKMKKSQNKSKTNSKTTLKTIPKINKKKNYQKGGAEPTEEEKGKYIVSSDNSSKNNEFIVYVNDIFDNPLKYLQK